MFALYDDQRGRPKYRGIVERIIMLSESPEQQQTGVLGFNDLELLAVDAANCSFSAAIDGDVQGSGGGLTAVVPLYRLKPRETDVALAYDCRDGGTLTFAVVSGAGVQTMTRKVPAKKDVQETLVIKEK